MNWNTNAPESSRWWRIAASLVIVSAALIGCKKDRDDANRGSTASTPVATTAPAAATSAEKAPRRANPVPRSLSLASAEQLLESAPEVVEPAEETAAADSGETQLTELVTSGLTSLFGTPSTETPTADGARQDVGGPTTEFTGFAISWPSDTLVVGGTAEVEVEATGEDGTEDVTDLVQWKASPHGRLLIVEGRPTLITAVATGSVTLTARFGSQTIGSMQIELTEVATPTEITGNWIDTTPNNGLDVDDSLFIVARVDDDLCLSTSSDATNIHTHFVGNETSGWSNYTVTGQLRIDSPTGGAGVTVLSDFPNTDRYYRLRRFDDGAFLLAPHGTSITGGTSESDVVPSANEWYEFLVEVDDVDDRTEIRAKIWPAGDPEPSEFQIDCFDDSSDRLTTGTVGFWAMGPGAKQLRAVEINGTHLPLPTPTTLELTATDTVLVEGESTDLSINALYLDGASVNLAGLVELEHGDCFAVSGDSNLTVTAVSEGTDNLLASFGALSASLSFECVEAGTTTLTGLTMDGPPTALSPGELGTISVFAQYSDGSLTAVTELVDWAFTVPMRIYLEPGDPATITGLFGGTTSVTATYQGVSATIDIEVAGPVPVESLQLTISESTLQMGEAASLTLSATHIDGSTSDMTTQASYVISNPNVIAIDGSGSVTAVGPGTSTVTANYGDQTSSVDVEVAGATIVSLGVTGPTTALQVGQSFEFTATASFTDGSTQVVTDQASIQISDPSVLTAAGSVITAVGTGSATIVASLGGQTSAPLLVEVMAAEITSISLGASHTSLLLGEIVMLSVTAQYGDGSTSDVTEQTSWTVSAPTVVWLASGPSASLTALSGGQSTVTAAVGGSTAALVFEVAAPTLDSIALTLSSSSSTVGETFSASAVGHYSDGQSQDLTDSVDFVADDDSIVAYSGGGVFTASSAGSTQIMAVLGEVNSNVVAVTVLEPTLESLNLAVSISTMPIGGTSEVTVLANYSDGNSVDVTGQSAFSVSNPSVLAMSAGSPAVATALADGTASIVASFSGMDSSPVSIQVSEVTPIELANWVDTMADSLSEDDTLFGVSILSSQLVMQTDSTQNNIHSHVVTEDSASWSGYEFTGRLQLENASGGVGVTFYSSFPEQDRYYRLRRYDGTDFFIAPHGTSITSGTTHSGVTPVAGAWYRFRIQVNETGSSTQILARVWNESQSEPGAWQINCQDANATRITSGTIGCWSMAAGSKCWSDFEVDSQPISLSQPFVLELSSSQSSLNVGDVAQLDLMVTDPSGSSSVTGDASFTVSQPDLLELDASGNITAMGPGFIQLTANYDGYSSNTVTVMIMPDGGATESGFASSITQHGITWIFDQAYPVGQFVNGDYWAVGPVSIVAIDPPSVQEGTRIRHGSMLNPMPVGTNHAYDSHLFGSHADDRYQADQNVAFGISGANPLVLGPDSSLVSTISKNEVAYTPPGMQGCSILTVLSAVPPEGSFRPPYAGSDKPLYNLVQMQTGLLGSYSGGGGEPSFEGVKAELERPWLDHVRGWLGRFLHPADNMPDYGRDMSVTLGKASLLVHLDAPLAEKMPVLIALVQIGIDFDGCFQNGQGWEPDGGHSVGRKWPIMFKRAMFGEPTDLAAGAGSFSEDGQTFHVQETSPGVYNYGFGDYGPGQNGMPDWGVRYWTKMPLGSEGTILWFDNPYRRCCTFNSSAGHLLSAYIMGLKPAWGWNPAFDYMDRFMQVESGWTRQKDSWSGYMWDTHRPGFGGYNPVPAEWVAPDM